jgi:hypothetical protein
MSWANNYIAQLQQGKTCQFRPAGNSMTGRINHRDLVTVEPYKSEELKVDDIVLVKVKGRVFLHLIKAISQERFLIGNNRGGTNGWANKKGIYGKVTQIKA